MILNRYPIQLDEVVVEGELNNAVTVSAKIRNLYSTLHLQHHLNKMMQSGKMHNGGIKQDASSKWPDEVYLTDYLNRSHSICLRRPSTRNGRILQRNVSHCMRKALVH